MREYVGTKKVKATPMTRGDYNTLRGWTIPENENPADEGYFIVYSDGYQSWTPKRQFDEEYRECEEMTTLPETALLMQSPDYKERFRAEYLQTKIRYEKLHKMCIKYEAGTLNFTPTCSLALLKEQKGHMGNYLHCLEVRAEIEKIEL